MKRTLLETIEILKKDYPDTPVLYKMYMDGEFRYTGIGGKGKRKGYLRLQEHYKATMPSSLKWKIIKEYINKKYPGLIDEAEDYFNSSLHWEFEVGDIDYIKNKEKDLIQTHNPKYNIEFNNK